MPLLNRTYNIGKIQELKTELRTIRIEIDSFVKNLVYHFDPMDSACDYVEKIDTSVLEVYMSSIKRKMIRLKKVKEQVEDLEKELGQSESGS
jgi:hypothetical protein